MRKCDVPFLGYKIKFQIKYLEIIFSVSVSVLLKIHPLKVIEPFDVFTLSCLR